MPRGGTGTKKRVPNIYVYIYIYVSSMSVWVSYSIIILQITNCFCWAVKPTEIHRQELQLFTQPPCSWESYFEAGRVVWIDGKTTATVPPEDENDVFLKGISCSRGPFFRFQPLVFRSVPLMLYEVAYEISSCGSFLQVLVKVHLRYRRIVKHCSRKWIWFVTTTPWFQVYQSSKCDTYGKTQL